MGRTHTSVHRAEPPDVNSEVTVLCQLIIPPVVVKRTLGQRTLLFKIDIHLASVECGAPCIP